MLSVRTAATALCLILPASVFGQVFYPKSVSWMGKDPLAREDAKRGRAEFQKTCSFCHGLEADGGAHGPNLVRSALVRHDKDGDLIGAVIREGRPEKGMPAFPLEPGKISDIVTFLHASVSASDSAGGDGPSRDYPLELLLTGDAGKGKAYFNGAGGCSGCHSPSGDLAGLAGKYPPIDLQARFLYPEGAQSTAVVTLPSGSSVTGELVHMDAFSVSIRDRDGWQHSWQRSGVKVKVNDPLAAHKELLHKYSNQDVHNLFAYLETLK